LLKHVIRLVDDDLSDGVFCHRDILDLVWILIEHKLVDSFVHSLLALLLVELAVPVNNVLGAHRRFLNYVGVAGDLPQN
jgi:predicted metal-dependent hydrolase